MHRVQVNIFPSDTGSYCAERLLSHFFILHRRCFSIKNGRTKEHYTNEEIRTLGYAPSKQLRIIGPQGEQLGLMTYNAALESAYDQGLDLVLIAPQSDPPVCKIIDYGKFRFERDKREKEARKKQQVVETKEVQLSCQIDVNDFNTKVNHAKRFLQAGNKVKVIVRFRGRQMSHTEVGRDMLERFRAACEELCTVDKAPVLEGRFMTLFLLPAKQNGDKAKKAPKAEKVESAPEKEASEEA